MASKSPNRSQPQGLGFSGKTRSPHGWSCAARSERQLPLACSGCERAKAPALSPALPFLLVVTGSTSREVSQNEAALAELPRPRREPRAAGSAGPFPSEPADARTRRNRPLPQPQHHAASLNRLLTTHITKTLIIMNYIYATIYII